MTGTLSSPKHSSIDNLDDLHSETKLFQVPNSCSIDQILFQLALSAMASGHRYGAFLDAATTAAKCAIYATYLMQGRNFRRTGLLHHVDPKRVKEIVQEVQSALTEGKWLKTLSTEEPQHLIYLPHLWLKIHPWQAGKSRFLSDEFSIRQRSRIEKLVSDDLPKACLLNSDQFLALIQQLHLEVQESSPADSYAAISDALVEHIKLRLLESGTVIQLSLPEEPPVYALGRTTYSPKDKRERVSAMLDDVADFFTLMQAWVNCEPGVLRGLETFNVAPEQREEALQELDKFMQSWADKYHQREGLPMILHVAAGQRRV